MSQEVHSALEAIYNTNDPAMQDLANRALQLKQALESKQISSSEFKELVTDLYHEKNINESVQNLELKQHINATMTALINLASLY